MAEGGISKALNRSKYYRSKHKTINLVGDHMKWGILSFARFNQNAYNSVPS